MSPGSDAQGRIPDPEKCALPWRRVIAAPLLLALVSCGGVSVQPLVPTPVLFSELGFSPLDHVPEDQRWTPRL